MDNAGIYVENSNSSGDADGDDSPVTHRPCHAVDVIVTNLADDPGAISQVFGQPRTSDLNGRPPVELCMVSSIDGSIAVDGRSGPLSGDEDRLVLSTLRKSAGVVLVGAGTIRMEGYLEPKPDGPLFAVVSASGNLDWESAFARSPRVVIVTTDETTIPHGVKTIRTGPGAIDLSRAVNDLHSAVPLGSFIHVEGGAQLNGALAALDLIDTVNLSISAQLATGQGPRLAANPIETAHRFDITHLVKGDQHLFTRWQRRRTAP